MAFKKNHELDKKLHDLITQEPRFAHLVGCVIETLVSDKEKTSKGMQVYGDCEKLSDKVALISGVDFVITFYSGWEYLSETGLRLLMTHELMHVGFEDNNGDIKKWIVPHDVNDFRDMIDENGYDYVTRCNDETA